MPLYNKQSRPWLKSRVSVSTVVSATRTLIKSVGRVRLLHPLSMLLEKRATKVNTSAPRIPTVVDTKERETCVDVMYCLPSSAIALQYSHTRNQDLPAGQTQENQPSIFKLTPTEQVTLRNLPRENTFDSRLAKTESPILCDSSTSSVKLPTDLKSRRQLTQSSMFSTRDNMMRDTRDIRAEGTSGRRNIEPMQKKTLNVVRPRTREDPTHRYAAYLPFATFEDLVKEVAKLDNEEPE